jgi:GTP-binding protein
MSLVAVVGRPNVGKSTLFNRILGKRQAIIEDQPGVTRDRNYGTASWNGRDFTLVDTGGFSPEGEGMLALVRGQAMLAVREADVILFVLDVRDGLTSDDLAVADVLRRSGKTVLAVVNKVEGGGRVLESAEFFALGMGEVFPVSSLHGSGVAELLDEVVRRLPRESPGTGPACDIKVAVIGRPNTGKSTLVNRLLGEDRLIVSEVPGTTRDAVDTLVVRGGRRYLFIDTAGIRRKVRIQENVERHSVMRSLNAVDRADVCLLLIDPAEGLTDQDLRLAGIAEEKGKALVVGVNKWDTVEKETMTFDHMVKDLRERLFFFSHAPFLSLSGKTGQRLDRVFPAIEAAYAEASREIPTSQLNRVLEKAVHQRHPQVVRGRIVKFYYAAQVAARPPTLLIFTNRPGEIAESYLRYLERFFREELGFAGTPIRLRFAGREGEKGGRRARAAKPGARGAAGLPARAGKDNIPGKGRER